MITLDYAMTNKHDGYTTQVQDLKIGERIKDAKGKLTVVIINSGTLF